MAHAAFALVFARGKEGAGEGRFCLDKGNYSRDCGMPRRSRVVNKQSNLITVTSYTPFRHQRGEVGLVKMFEPQQLFVPAASGLGRARSDWGTFHVSRGLKHLKHPTDTL